MTPADQEWEAAGKASMALKFGSRRFWSCPAVSKRTRKAPWLPPSPEQLHHGLGLGCSHSHCHTLSRLVRLPVPNTVLDPLIQGWSQTACSDWSWSGTHSSAKEMKFASNFKIQIWSEQSSPLEPDFFKLKLRCHYLLTDHITLGNLSELLLNLCIPWFLHL